MQCHRKYREDLETFIIKVVKEIRCRILIPRVGPALEADLPLTPRSMPILYSKTKCDSNPELK